MIAPRSTFDLRTEPWVLVRSVDRAASEVALLDAFADSPRLHGLGGEVPTQQVAVLRLMLAILHRAVPVGDNEPEAVWSEIWDAGKFPVDLVEAYLAAHADRFDLLHPETPFYQVASLRTGRNEVAGLERLIADVPSGHQYFTTRAGPALRRISFGEAARWLVHCQAYDVSGIKSGAVGDERVKGGKGYPIGTAWVGQLGAVVVEGSTLFETLMLNLVLQPPSEPRAILDLPVWERDPQGPGIEAGHHTPAGLADLLTWQSRRLRLVHDGTAVTAVVLANGDPLGPQNRHIHEVMTGWRRSKAQEQKAGRDVVYMPSTHQPDRALWRGFESLLAEHVAASGGRDAEPYKQPGVFEWISALRQDEVLDADHVVRTRAIGIEYGSQSSVIKGMVDDAVLLHVAVLSDRVLRRCATDAVVVTRAGVRALSDLAGNLVRAAGGDPGGARDRAAELAYSRLDGPYRQWVGGLRLGSDTLERHEAWERAAHSVLVLLGNELVEEAGTPAWVGREVDGKRVDSALAARWFHSALRKALPHLPEPVSAVREVEKDGAPDVREPAGTPLTSMEAS